MRWSLARFGEESCAVRFEEVLGDDCRCAVDCFANLDESSADRFVNTVVHAGHPGRNHCFLDSGHLDIGHGRCRYGSGRHRGGNRHHGVDDLMTMVACYPYYGRIDAPRAMSSCSEARSDELEPPPFS